MTTLAHALQEKALVRYLEWASASSQVSIEGAPAGGCMVAFWHEWVLTSLAATRGMKNLAVYVWDQPGMSYSIRLIERLGLRVIAARRDNAYAVREVARFVGREHGVVAITLDGPNGPPRAAKPGVVRLARLAGVPLHPLSISAAALFRTDGWDRCVMPDAQNRITLRVLPVVPETLSMREATRALEDALSGPPETPARRRAVSDWPALAWARAATFPLRLGTATLWPEARSASTRDRVELGS